MSRYSPTPEWIIRGVHVAQLVKAARAGDMMTFRAALECGHELNSKTGQTRPLPQWWIESMMRDGEKVKR